MNPLVRLEANLHEIRRQALKPRSDVPQSVFDLIEDSLQALAAHRSALAVHGGMSSG